MSTVPILEARGLTRKFGGLTAVNEVDLKVNDNEVVGLIGPNGAGKTTLFNCIAGSMPPTSGTVAFQGKDCTGFAAHKMARLGVTRTFQITSIFPAMSTFDNVRAATFRTTSKGWVPALFHTPGYREQEAAVVEKVYEILDFVHLGERAHFPADALSYGEHRRLEIAIALAADPKLLLLDEPAAGMNPEEGQKLVGMINDIRGRGVAVLLVEHHMRVVMGVCDRVVVIDHGVKIAEGAPREVADNPDVIRVYLGREQVSA
ncbi:branched-chain amino acid transport system ATP-binding protein [Rhodoligotrophos appendicifer]|uniref:ABC transporter ATP-binding protein n=1 Tax=Rhodoligotrophos appendicifer TaxID=987056 RepID=UPI0011847756|nr:ABC transporter ATP-binding protein [Rhodoligotrophos appendicifer]